jgi:hypothetical protein
LIHVSIADDMFTPCNPVAQVHPSPGLMAVHSACFRRTN